MTKLKFKVKLEGMKSSEVAALSAPFDVEKTLGTRARRLAKVMDVLKGGKKWTG